MRSLFSGTRQLFKDQKATLVHLFSTVSAICIFSCIIQGIIKNWSLRDILILCLINVLAFCLLELLILPAVFLFCVCWYVRLFWAVKKNGTDTVCRWFLNDHSIQNARWFFSDRTLKQILDITHKDAAKKQERGLSV